MARQDLRGRYVQQVGEIVADVIGKGHKLEYKEGCF